MKARLTLAAGLVLLAGAASANELATRGQAIVVAKCATCHAVGDSGSSPLAQAPTFRDLHRKYNVEHLAEALAEGISTGHPDMPVFAFEPPEIDAIVGYLKSLEPRRNQTK